MAFRFSFGIYLDLKEMENVENTGQKSIKHIDFSLSILDYSIPNVDFSGSNVDGREY